MDSVCDLLASRARGSGATFQPAVMPPSYVPESETIQGPAVDTRGSIPNLEATRGTAGQWSARLQPWIARFNEFKLPAKTASKSDHDARVAALEALLSEWAREADLYQRFVEVAQLVLASAVGNIEILAQRGEQANAMAYAEQQQAQALWNAGDRDGAQLHADAAQQYLDYAAAYTGAARELQSYWHPANQAVAAVQQMLVDTVAAANRAADAVNDRAATDWGGVALLAAVLLAAGLAAGGLRR